MGAAFLKEPKTDKEVDDGESAEFKYGLASMQGWRAHMEDAHIVRLSSKQSSDRTSFFAVFDGHCGSEVAHYCAARWVSTLQAMESYQYDLPAAMKKSFFALDEALLDPVKFDEFRKNFEARRRFEERKQNRSDDRDQLEREVRARMDDANSRGSLSSNEALALAEIMSELEQEHKTTEAKVTAAGCTAICAAVRGKKLYVANAGDSRAVMCRKDGKVIPLSDDHKPDKPVEQERILNAGGWVSQDGRVNGQLALSRAIGDFTFKKNPDKAAHEQAVTCDPDMMEIDIQDDDEFMILACDGIWDVVSNEEAVNFIRKGMQSEPCISKVVSALLDHCLAASTAELMGTDNMTCLVVTFKAPL